MTILGVDCGSRVTGYGVIEARDSSCRLVDCGVVRPPGGAPLAARLLFIHDALRNVIRNHAPEAAVFESIFHAANAQSALKLGHARGVSMLAAAEAAVPIFEYTALQVKSAVTGYGRAEKAQVQRMVQSILEIAEAPAPFDASDALAVAICHAQSRRYAEATAAP